MAAVTELRRDYPLAALLKLAGIPRSTYYYHSRKANAVDKYAKERAEIIHDKRMNDCLPPILFSAIFKLLKVLPDTELDAC